MTSARETPRPIGGFFELELGPPRGAGYHSDALALTSGRACLRAILEHERPRRVHLPYYACDLLARPLERMRVPHVRYAIDERLEPIGPATLEEGELLVYIDYFGLKNDVVNRLHELHGPRLIVDRSQAFFARRLEGCWSFNSARKFFGVPDGAYLYAPVDLPMPPRATEVRYRHLVERLLGQQERAYRSFLDSEAHVDEEVAGMSTLSERILARVDFDDVADRRRRNFQHYDEAFGRANRLRFDRPSTEVPMCYPLLVDREIRRDRLFERRIFVPTYWADVVERGDPGHAWEEELTRRLLALPVDHRYDEVDCDRVIAAVHDLVETPA